MSERTAILAAVLSSAFGGTAPAATRYVIDATDPVTLAAFRFGVGFLLLLPLALALGRRWPRGRDWLGVAGLGTLFFAVFFVFYNAAFIYTTAARGALALSAMPLLTMAIAALLGIEKLSVRKGAGVAIAVGGVAVALASGLGDAPPGAWRGDLIMAGGAVCMALYNVWSRPFIARSSALGFLTAGMGIGAACLVATAWLRGGFGAALEFGAPQWTAVASLGFFASALSFYLWVFALERTTPTRVANTITVNPVTAALLAVPLLGEPIGLNLVLGLVAVGAGIWLAATERPSRASCP